MRLPKVTWGPWLLHCKLDTVKYFCYYLLNRIFQFCHADQGLWPRSGPRRKHPQPHKFLHNAQNGFKSTNLKYLCNFRGPKADRHCLLAGQRTFQLWYRSQTLLYLLSFQTTSGNPCLAYAGSTHLRLPMHLCHTLCHGSSLWQPLWCQFFSKTVS